MTNRASRTLPPRAPALGRLATLSLLLLTAACSGDETLEPGVERGPCYGNGTCNTGLVCLSEVCVAAPDGGGVIGDDAAVADAEPAPDAAAADAEAVPDAAPSPDAGPGDAAPADADDPPDGAAADADVTPDAAAPDAAPDAGPADSGAPDAGRPDAGPDTNCNPVDNTGCAANACFWDPRIDRRSCRAATGMGDLEQPCDVSTQNCGVGFACTQTGNQAAPECHRVCDVFRGGLSCQNLPGRHPVYNCSVINGSQQYGVCLGRGSFCHPLTAPCQGGEVCTLNGGQTICSPAGNAQRDQPCSIINNCAVNQGLCINLGGAGDFCRQPCDPATPATCGGAARCVQIIGETYGVCLPVSCHPFTNACPAGQVCSAVNGPVECRPAGNVGIGGACSAANECSTGVCVDLGSGDRCERPCDGNNPCGGSQVCVTLTGFGFGICR